MQNQTLNSSAPFNVENIITMLVASPERDYEVLARMVYKLVDKDTIDLNNLGSDLTYTDKKQMLGIASNRDIFEGETVWHIGWEGVSSPEYEFALERRLGLIRRAILKGVKKERDKEFSRVLGSLAPRQPNFNSWLKQQSVAKPESLAEEFAQVAERLKRLL